MKNRQPVRGRHRTDAPGRHRADGPLFGHGRHRAPLDVTERGRQVAATAALLASVGIGGAAFTSRSTPPNHTATLALEARAPVVTTPPAAAAPITTQAVRADGGTAAATPAARKPADTLAKAAIVKSPAEAEWVDPFPQGHTTSCFGERWGRLHAGVDRAAPAGTPVRAVGAGKIVAAGPNYGGYGISVLIDHGNGYLTHYAHLQSESVSVGQRVDTGAVIGKEGNTGHSTGPHLHFEVHKGHFQNPVEPVAWLRAHGIVVKGC